jgi:hypothetical protein
MDLRSAKPSFIYSDIFSIPIFQRVEALELNLKPARSQKSIQNIRKTNQGTPFLQVFKHFFTVRVDKTWDLKRFNENVPFLGNPCGQIGGDLLTVKLVICGGKEPPHVCVYIYI